MNGDAVFLFEFRNRVLRDFLKSCAGDGVDFVASSRMMDKLQRQFDTEYAALPEAERNEFEVYCDRELARLRGV